MIPIRAQRRSKQPPLIVWMLVAVCTAVLLRLAWLPDERASGVVHALGVTPARLLAAPLSADQLVTLLSSPFLHAGWVHLAGNMLFLTVFGPVVLDRIKPLRFMGLYVTAGVVGALSHTLNQPTSLAPLVGASGAIAGVLGAHLVLEPRSKITTIVPLLVYFEVASLPAAFVIGLWFLLQLGSALAQVTQGVDAVAWFAHLGGFATGLLYGGLVALKSRGAPRTQRRPKGRRSRGIHGRRAA